MKVYIAAAYAARDLLRENLVPILERLGHESTSGWLNGTREITVGTIGASLSRDFNAVQASAVSDFAQIEEAGVVLLLTGHAMLRLAETKGIFLEETTLHTGGRHTEVGYALANGKPVIVAGPPENVFQRTLCQPVPSLAQALDLINDLRVAGDDGEEPRNTEYQNDIQTHYSDPRSVRFSG